MARWLIQLEGDHFDLEEFPYWFPDGDIHAVEDNGAVYLTGPLFAQYSEASQVLEAAAEGLDDFTAIVRLLWPALNRPSIGTVFHEDDQGNRRGYVFMSAHAVSRSKARASLTVNGISESKSSPTQAQLLLSASHASPHLRMAVMLWAEPTRTWPRLYRIMEELELHLKVPLDKAGLCDGQRNLFKRSANTAEVAGRDSRHALTKFTAPSKPMSVDEASTFIGAMLQAVLRRASTQTEDPSVV